MNPKHTQLIALLKGKGTGQTMGKTLDALQLKQVGALFSEPGIPLTTKATLLTALLTLDPTDVEKNWIHTQQQQLPDWPVELTELLHYKTRYTSSFKATISSVIQHQDLSYDAFTVALDSIFNPKTPLYLKASFLEAERLKRETPDENIACYDYFWSHAKRLQTNFPLIVDLAYGYDGFNRTPYLAPKLAMAFAKKGIPTILHGMDDVSPKFGNNSHKILTELGISIPTTLASALDMLHKEGWTYIDQRVFFPELYALKTLRTLMVKRPLIATVEKLLQPIRAKQGNFVITGYTHPPYKDKMLTLLRHQNRCDSFLLVRGKEGSPQLGFDKRSPYVNSLGEADFFKASDHTDHHTEEQLLEVSCTLFSGMRKSCG